MELPAPRRAHLILVALIAAWSVSLPVSAAVGRTAGQPGVTPGGEAAYSIPLRLPPGTNGLAPSLSLEYRHTRRSGLLGAGWSIGGLSRIERCPRTLAQDGVTGPVTQYASDRFCLDGQRLVLANGYPYGAAGAEYRTEVESFMRVRSFGSAGTGPAYFVAEAPDGRILEYGATADSRIDVRGILANGTLTARAWALSRVRDRSGNAITFEYTEDAATGSWRIATIRYNQNPGAGVAASHVVSFFYEIRPASDIDASWVAGTPVRQVVRLDRIDVLYNGSVVRRYELTYQPALSSAGRSRLASVQECGAGGTDCYAPTLFTWQDGAPGLGAESTVGASTAVFSQLATDINGDGRDDLVWAGGSPTSQTIRYRLALAAGGFGPEIDTRIASISGVGAPLDWNGDGLGDLILMSTTWQWLVVPGTANGFGAAVHTGLATGNVMDFRGADLNGDGLDDLAYSEIVGTGPLSLFVQVRYAQPGGSFGPPALLYDQPLHTGYEWPEGGYFLGAPGQRIDLDGDGRDDLLMDEQYSMARISADFATSDYFDSTFHGGTPADVNGDGCTDFVYPHYTGAWRVRFSGCHVLYWPAPELIGPSSSGLQYGAVAFDWNEDGRDDVLYRTTAGNWWVMTSTGATLLPPASTGVPHNGATGLLVADLNGDDLHDALSLGNSQLRYRLQPGPMPDLLRSATDGFGVASVFVYAPLSDPGIYTRHATAVWPDRDVQDARYVVATLSMTDGSGTGSVATRRYAYEGLRVNSTGRGSLGFAKRTVLDNSSGQELRHEDSYRQDFPFTGLTARNTVRQASGLPLHDVDSRWSAIPYNDGGERHFPYAASVTERRYAAGGAFDGVLHTTVVRTVATVDPLSGLATDHSVTVSENATGLSGGGWHTRRVLHSAVLNDLANWCLGRPQATQVTARHSLPGGSTVTRSLAQSWDSLKCRPTQQQLEPGGGPWQVSIGLGYDGFGNLSSRVVTGSGMSPRTAMLSFGPRGQFPMQATNALGHVTTFAWDFAQGVVIATTDPNALTTTWSHDGFGRPLTEVRPDQTRTAWHWSPCNGCDARTRYSLQIREHDSSGIVQQTQVVDFDQFDRPYRVAKQRPGSSWSEVVSDWDARGRTVRRHLPRWQGGLANGHWEVRYDALDRVIAESLHDGSGAADRTWAYTYDGLAVVRTDARGNSSALVTTAWGDVLRVTDALGGFTRYEHDAFGRLTRVTDALGNVVASIAYNVTGMKIRQTDADLGTWTFLPNALGELVARTDAKGQVTSLTWDKLSRPLTRSEPEGLTTWTWGTSAAARNIGQLTSVAGPGYSESYAYDALARPATRTIVSDATYQYAFAYNGQGLLDSLTYPASTGGYRLKLGYEYAFGQVVAVRDRSVPATVLWERKAEDAAGRVLHETLGAAINVVTGFSPRTGLMEFREAGVGSSTALQNLAWQWDAAGNLTARLDQNRGLTESFDYDALDRVVRAQLNGATSVQLRYDAIGNITWKSDVGDYTYDPARRHAVVAAGSNQFAYDANGNMSRRNGATQSWFSYNLPATLTAANGNSSQFAYTFDRSRWRQVASESGSTETTVYVGGLLEKVTRSGVTTFRHYVPSPTGTAALYLRRSGGSPAEATYYLTHDHLGSTDLVLNAAGVSVTVAESFDAFGRRRGGDWSGAPDAAALAAIAQTTRDGFTGHEHLDGLGLIHMNGRVYDPVVARFLSADPYVQAPLHGQSLNRYAYAWNNPLSLTDPSGFQAASPADGPSPGAGKWLCWGGQCDDVLWWLGIALSARAGQVASSAERDPCGQDGSAMACQRPRGGTVTASAYGPGDLLADAFDTAARLTGSALKGTGLPEMADLIIEAAIGFDSIAPGMGTVVGTAASAFTESNIGSTAIALATLPAGGGGVAARVARATRHGPTNPGPLAHQISATFSAGSYTARVLDEPITLYRVIGPNGNSLGRFWTRTKPSGPLQAVIDLAIDQNWRNPATRIVTAEIPAGTTIYEGIAAAQRGLVGGANQVYIPKVDPRWLR